MAQAIYWLPRSRSGKDRCHQVSRAIGGPRRPGTTRQAPLLCGDRGCSDPRNTSSRSHGIRQGSLSGLHRGAGTLSNPFFGRMTFEEITPIVIADFDGWRSSRLRKTPRASTLRTHASAFRRVIDAAKSRGLLAINRPAPSLPMQGHASEPRPSFSRDEIDYLLDFMAPWSERGEKATEKLMRPFLRDYVEFLVHTGIRHGTKSMRLQWQHLQRHCEGERRYLRIWVSGKTGPRYLIAKMGAISALEHLALRSHGKDVVTLIEERNTALLFVFATGHQPRGLEGAFKRLRDQAKELRARRQLQKAQQALFRAKSA